MLAGWLGSNMLLFWFIYYLEAFFLNILEIVTCNSVQNEGLFISGCRFKMPLTDSVGQNAQVIGSTPPIHSTSYGSV